MPAPSRTLILSFLLVCLGLARAAPAVAFEPVELGGVRTEIFPEHPTDRTPLEIRQTRFNGASNGFTTPQVVGNRILMVSDGNDFAYDGPTMVVSNTIGPLPAGTYTVEFYLVSLLFPDPSPLTLAATRSLSIARTASTAPAVMVPAAGPLGLLLLLAAVGAFAVVFERDR